MKSNQMYFITGHLYFALSIASSEISSKIVLFIIGVIMLLFGYSVLKMGD